MQVLYSSIPGYTENNVVTCLNTEACPGAVGERITPAFLKDKHQPNDMLKLEKCAVSGKSITRGIETSPVNKSLSRRRRKRCLLPINLGDSHFPRFFGAVIQCEITQYFHEA